MSLQFAAARAISSVSAWGLTHVFHRPAANFPGKIALYADPCVIEHAAQKLSCGSVVVVGTNGKTTVTNLLADVLEQSGKTVICNRTGANLDSGVATALLRSKPADWGIFESDELWLAKSLPQLQANYVVLLNLFRDQLDRVGEIDRIQDSIVEALASSPETVLVFNADDPLCATIADRASNVSIGFGIGEDLGLPQNTVADAQMCQKCSTMFEYAYRQYGQLGEYRCPNCGFSRPDLAYAVHDVHLGADGLAFSLARPKDDPCAITASFSGAYMVYNLAAVAVAAHLTGCTHQALQQAIDAFDPQNGRLQTFNVNGRKVLLNLAKNPTGFNQNLKIVAQDKGEKVVAFFINDKEADGHDVSWLWDIDFEELCESGATAVYAGGIRGRDMQVRLKYADIQSEVVADAQELLAQMAALPTEVNAYLIANYTALPGVKSALEAAGSSANAPGTSDLTGVSAQGVVSEQDDTNVPSAGMTVPVASTTGDTQPAQDDCVTARTPQSGTPVVIAHLFPDLLNLYGDGGNVRVLEQRLRWRGIPVEVRRVKHGQSIDLSTVDLVFLGGGPDREQRLASCALMEMREELAAFVENDGVLLSICGGYQILGHEWLLGEEVVKGLGLVDITTERAPGGSINRLIDNIVLRSPEVAMPIVGYENHAGRTHLGSGVQPFGEVVSSTGHGNNDDDKRDGIRYKNAIGTYLHGPLLAKNPLVADDLLARALVHQAQRCGEQPRELTPLDDAAERGANEALCARFGVR